MPWEKIEPEPRGANVKRREVPAVSRSKKRPKSAYILLPGHMADGVGFVDVFSGDDGKIALRFHELGAFCVRNTSAGSTTKRIVIPAPIVHLIPFGLAEVTVSRDGDLTVLSL